MSSRFLIPATLAAALHALAFFGFRPASAPHALPAPAPSEILERLVLETLSEPPPEETSEAPAGMPDASRREEPPAPAESSPRNFSVPVVAPLVGPIQSDRLVPTGPIGRSDEIGVSCPGSIISSSGLDNPPNTRSRIAPAYPFEARSQGRSGQVLVEFVVDEAGRVLNPKVIHSTDPIFEEPTLRAVAKWRFEPGRKNGRTVRFRMALPVQFAVTDNS